MNRIGLVTYVAREYDEAIEFFVGKLGFTLVEDTDMGDGKRWVVVSAGEGASLLIARAEGEQQEASIGNQTGGRVGFFLQTDNFERGGEEGDAMLVEGQDFSGRNNANLGSAKAARDIAVAQYEKAIQTAFREVADALAGSATLGDQLTAQQVQATAEAERFRLAELRYRNGVSSFLDVLDAQRSLFTTQQALAQTRLAQQQNQVALYKALGGGWGQE